jgi:hypothetical protein
MSSIVAGAVVYAQLSVIAHDGTQSAPSEANDATLHPDFKIASPSCGCRERNRRGDPARIAEGNRDPEALKRRSTHLDGSGG